MHAELFYRTGARMDEVPAQAASLVLTGPPYFPQEVEKQLKNLSLSSPRIERLVEELVNFALSLRPVFEDCARTLGAGCPMVLQTRDVRIGDRLIPIASIHRTVGESVGFELFTRYLWMPPQLEPDRKNEAESSKKRGRPRPVDLEEFLVFLKPGTPHTQGEPNDEDLNSLSQTVISTKRGRMPKPHRFQAPLPICELFVRAFTKPGDLVVDPFAGNGTTLLAAQRLGRRAIGYEVDPLCIEGAIVNLEWASDE